MARGKKSAILVGCGYYGTSYLRYGCETDMDIIKEFLLNFDFDPDNIKMLKETINPSDSTNQPTSFNIQNELRKMINTAREGDVLFFYFSGLVKKNQSNNIPGIFSCDQQLVPATEFHSPANQLPMNTSFTLVLDSSYSGDFINPVKPEDNWILFSACQVNETSKRVVPDGDNASAYGVFTEAIQMVLRQYPPLPPSRPARPITNNELLRGVSARIERFHQHPCLCCNDKNRNARFLDYLVTGNM